MESSQHHGWSEDKETFPQACAPGCRHHWTDPRLWSSRHAHVCVAGRLPPASVRPSVHPTDVDKHLLRVWSVRRYESDAEMEETPSCPAQHIVSPPHPHPALPASTQASTHPHQLPPLPAGTRSPSRRSTCLSSQHPGPSSWACSEPCVSPRCGGPEPLSRVCCPRASSIVPTARRGLCHYCPLSWGPQGWGGRNTGRGWGAS